MTREQDRRQQIEQVLKKHQVNSVCQGARVAYNSSVCTFLLEDLLALAPEPSRGILLAIISRHHQCTISAIVECQNCLALVEKVLAWARGETRKGWCCHWRRSGDGWVWNALEATTVHAPERSWDICPTAGCHAPRPAETPPGEGVSR